MPRDASGYNGEMVEIWPYDASWRQEFEAIGKGIRETAGKVALRIDHIGSTSIEDLGAKPVIDIQISVAALEPMDGFHGPLTMLGYVWRKDNPERTKRYYRESPGMRRTHIHVRVHGSWHEQFALLFRDYLRGHVEDRHRYEAEKRRLAERFRFERDKYTDAKDEIFWEIMQRADRWAAATGWQPGASDA